MRRLFCAVLALALAGCQSDNPTPFPSGTPSDQIDREQSIRSVESAFDAIRATVDAKIAAGQIDAGRAAQIANLEAEVVRHLADARAAGDSGSAYDEAMLGASQSLSQMSALLQ